MKKKLPPILIFVAAVSACGGSTLKNVGKTDAGTAGNSAPFLRRSGDTVYVSGMADTIVTRFHKPEWESVYLCFYADSGKVLSGEVIPDDPLGNIRFALLALPDGETDGPFGREMDYYLPRSGDYCLRISENMMAGDPWGGEAEVRIILRPFHSFQ